MRWNFGDILDAVTTITDPEQPALIHGDRVFSRAQSMRDR